MKQQSNVVFRGIRIPVCRKPELIGIFKLTFQRLKNASKALMPEILKPL
jgi:hypothetical protein